MATIAPPSVHVDTRLREIAAEAEFLPELAAGWAEETPANRDVWYIEWRELMARLADLDRAYRDGRMTAQQREAFCGVRRALARHLPLLKQLDLPVPPVPLED